MHRDAIFLDVKVRIAIGHRPTECLGGSGRGLEAADLKKESSFSEEKEAKRLLFLVLRLHASKRRQ
jgi:hypothetical protein